VSQLAWVHYVALLLSSADRRLSGRLLPQTVPLPSLPVSLRDVRRLLPQAGPLYPLPAMARIMRRLLPQALAELLLVTDAGTSVRVLAP
jgi:hypothetical protein